MALIVRRLGTAIPIALAALELSHPTSQGGVAQAVAAAGSWWLPLHLLLIAGYAAVVRLLWGPGFFVRATLVAFLVSNTAFVAVDGVAVGLLAVSDPRAADDLWNSALVAIMANLTGATWAASLLCVAAAQLPPTRTRPTLVGLALTFVVFLASVPPLAAPPLLNRLTAAATGAWIVYASGAAGVQVALLVFAAILRQHVGAEAALGMLLVGIALTRLRQHG